MTLKPHIEQHVTHEIIEAFDSRGRAVAINLHKPRNGSEHEVPVVLANGWAAGHEIMSRVAIWMAWHEGRTVATFDHHRNALSGEEPETHKMETLTAVVDGTLAHTKQESAEIMAHSEGGINGTMYATREVQRESGKVAKLTLVTPAGTSKIWVPDLIARGFTETIVCAWDPSKWRHLGKQAIAGLAGMHYLLGNLELSISEVLTIADTNVVDQISAIHESGVPIGVVGGTQDSLFPSSSLQQQLPPNIPYKPLPHANHTDFINDRAIRKTIYDFHQDLGSDTTYLRAS